MLRMLVGRAFSALLVLLAVTFAVSAITKIIPGDPVDVILVGNPGLSEEDMNRLRETLGLNKSVVEQFLSFTAKAVQGDFGRSIHQGMPNSQLIFERLPATAELAFFAIVLALLVAVPLGVATAIRRNSAVDYFGTAVAVFGVSVPGFLIGIFMITIFAVSLRWLPASGYRGSALMALWPAIASADPAVFWKAFRYFIMPAVSLSFVLVAVNTRLVRSGMLEVLGQDFISFAFAKGIPSRVVYFKHALKNTLLPIVTVVGLQLGALFSGAIIIEEVFAWPGVGRLAVQAVASRDYTLLQTIVLFAAILFVTLNIVVDLLYTWLDPRVKMGGRR